jgi:putative salt-induced outer membrane protein YdiY
MQWTFRSLVRIVPQWVAIGLVGLAWPARDAAAQPPALDFSADASQVMTSGNSAASTLGFKSSFSSTWPRVALSFKGGGMQTRSTTLTRFAIADPVRGLTIDEQALTATSAENFSFGGRVDRKLTERVSWNAGSGWERNRYAGIVYRIVTFAGGGLNVISRPEHEFKLTLGATHTTKNEVVANPATPDDFLGARLTGFYKQKLSSNTTLTENVILDENLHSLRDFRGESLSEIAVTMSRHLALKVSLRATYDYRPALTDIAILTPDRVPTGERLQAPLKKLDTVFTLALALNLKRAAKPSALASPPPPAGPPPSNP